MPQPAAAPRRPAMTSTAGGRPQPGGPLAASSAVADDASSAHRDALRVCEEVQHMIDINSDHLERLRTSMGEKASTSELTKQEIRTLEGKLICLFSQQIAARAGAASLVQSSTGPHIQVPAAFARYPSLSQWLRVVGVSPDSRKALEARTATLDQLRDKTESEVHRIILASPVSVSSVQRNEDLRRLSRAMQGLKRYGELLKTHGGGPATRQEAARLELYWDSWNRAGCPPPPPSSSSTAPFASNPPSSASSLECSASSSSSSPKPETATLSYVYGSPAYSVAPHGATTHPHPSSNLPPKPESLASSLSSNSSLASSLPPQSPGVAFSPPVMNWPEKKPTPPTTPPWSAAASILGAKKQQQSQMFPSTPPPVKKHSITAASAGNSSKAAAAAAAVAAAAAAGTASSEYPLTKSRSHECELGNRINPNVSVQTQTATVDSSSGRPVGVSLNAAVAKIGEESRDPSSSLADNGSTSTSSYLPGGIMSTSTTSTSSMSYGRRPRQAALSESSAAADDLSSSTTAAESTPSPLPSPSPFEASESSGNSLQVPKSPRTPRSMGHAIRHRFKKTLKPGRCDHCSEYMFNGLKCRECKFKCHRDCESRVPPSCSLPDDLVDFYMKQITREGSPILPTVQRQQGGGGGFPGFATASMPHGDFRLTGSLLSSSLGGGAGGRGTSSGGSGYPESSSTTSSCNSSTPSSPAVVVTSSHPTPPHSASSKGQRFIYPPVTLKLEQEQPYQQQHHQPPHSAGAGYGGGGAPQTLFPSHPPPPPRVPSPNPIVDSIKSYDSDKTLSGTSGSSGSASTAYRLDSQDSTASVDDPTGTWTAGRQTSISLREWDIPYEDLDIGDKIGAGRFSTVYQGKWHGPVAIKILRMDNMDDADATLEAFRLDVGTFRNTRHENVILFMGACMKPPNLAIVTTLCKGNTLYTTLHRRKDKLPMNKVIMIAQQIAQGMGYLHHRGIVHKDLKTKNIFLENGHAIIADFGLVNVARRLCAQQGPGPSQSSEYLSIPKGWLCYLAPEILRALRVTSRDNGNGSSEDDLPFSKSSDVFAFGTVWFELLTSEWPWRGQPPEVVIWKVGRGGLFPLANHQAFSRDVKDVLMACWNFRPDLRPDFPYISALIEQIPQKRGLSRSPSHPVHLSRSAESMI